MDPFTYLNEHRELTRRFLLQAGLSSADQLPLVVYCKRSLRRKHSIENLISSMVVQAGDWLVRSHWRIALLATRLLQPNAHRTLAR